MTCLNNATLNVKAGLNRSILILLCFMHFSVLGLSQNKESADSLVRLVEAVSAHLIEEDGISYRKVIGPATFLHNNTYLKCDTALWNVNTNIIDAVGNVEIIQENTRLTSDSLKYDIPANLAMFRGSLVELSDKEGNILNTNYLNYNTRDSVGTFYFGASMKSNDGKIMESDNGMYTAQDKKFTFEDNVQIFTDSVLIVSTQVDYLTQTDIVVFGGNTVAWKDENMLFANAGDFNRPLNLFTFNKDGYILTKEQEMWGDIIRYYRNSGMADLYENVQILDTVQRSIAMADKIIYRPGERKVELTQSPVVGMYSYENNVADTLFLAADTIIYRTRRMYEVDSASVAQAAERIKLSEIDPIAIHDQERKAARAKKNDTPAAPPANGGLKAPAGGGAKLSDAPVSGAVKDAGQTGVPLSGKVASDTLSLGVQAVADSSMVQKDTTDVTFIDAFHNVKFYRSDIQGLCDSLVYTGLDSMARFYKRPVMWYNAINQFTADSIQAVIKNRQMSKANLLSNAFIAVQEDTVHYNQIKATEMAAYFRNNELYRFDGLGGVSAIFYMEEDSTITLMDQEECKMLTARIKDNQIQRTRSIEDLKQNVFPVFNLSLEEQRLKGFEWRGEERPETRFDVTSRKVRKSSRAVISATELPEFIYTHKYFPDAMPPIMDYRQYIIDISKREPEENIAEVQ